MLNGSNNVVTWASLKCPPKQLDCVLREVFCKYVNSECLDVDVSITNNILTVRVGLNSDSINLSNYLDDTKITAYTINSLTGVITITENNGSSWSINILNAIKNLQTLTTLDFFGVTGSDIVIKYTGENGVQQTKTMLISDICDHCSACIGLGQTLSYTVATRLLTGTAGQTIFVTDMLASDGSIGCLEMWQLSTNSWKKIMIT